MSTFRILKWGCWYFNVFSMPKKMKGTQIACDIERGGERGVGEEGERRRGWRRGLALFVELVEDRSQQRRDHLEGVERAAV